MATQVSSDAEKVLAGITPEARTAILSQTPGDRLTSGEASRLLEAFKVSGNPYAAANVSATSTAPAARPDYSDPLGLRQYFLDQMGVGQAQTDLNDITSRLNAFDTETDMTLNAIENRPVRLGVITGEQAATERSRSTTRSSLAREALAKQSFLDAARTEANTRFDIANAERDKLQQLILKSGGKAGITYGDTLEVAAAKLSTYEKKVADEQAKEERKQKLKDLAISAGISTKNKKGGSLSTKDLEKAIAKAAKKDKDLEDKLNNLKMQAAEVDLAKAKKELNKADDSGYSDDDLIQYADLVLNGLSLNSVPSKIRNSVGAIVLKNDPNFSFSTKDTGFNIEE